jgi:hypothetical protein
MLAQVLHPAKLSITIDGETKVFHDKTKSFHKSSPTKNNRWKTTTQEGKLHPRKSTKVKFLQQNKKKIAI